MSATKHALVADRQGKHTSWLRQCANVIRYLIGAARSRADARVIRARLRTKDKEVEMSAHEYEFKAIDGKPLKLDQFAGKTVLVVNTASECGFTPQYAGLESLWRKYKDRGLVGLGVPSNDFGRQEPGTEAEISNFCSARYGVTFPLTAKYPVTGKDAHPLYQWITAQAGDAAAPRWNFHKYLIDRKGELVDVFPSKVAPESKQLVEAIEEQLGS